MLEITKHFKARSHRVRLSVSSCIESAIRFGNGMLWIRGKVIPEVLEINPLAAGDKLKRRGAVEVKMPQIPQQPNAFPITHPGKKSIHQHDRIDFNWNRCSIRVTNHQSVNVANNP